MSKGGSLQKNIRPTALDNGVGRCYTFSQLNNHPGARGAAVGE